MSLKFDLTKEFEELKASFTCDVCKNVLRRPVILATCKHVACGDCLDGEALKCPVCKSPYSERDVEDDVFGASVATALNNIQQTSEMLLQGFKVSVVRTVMKRNPKGETPLHLACKKGNAEKLEELLQASVDVNATDYANWTSLHETVEHGSYDCCRLLLQNGALPDVPGEFYTTPLHKAVALDDTRITELLIKYGASKNSTDYFGKKAGDLCVSHEMKNVLENTSAIVETKPIVYLDQSPTIFCKEISKECRGRLIKSKVKFVSHQDFVKREYVTHFVLEHNDRLDVNVLIAIVKGAFVVRKQWIDDYREDEAAFDYVPEKYAKAVRKSVCNRWTRRPKLFDGINFHIVDHERPQKIYGVNLSRQDLITLIEKGGGTHVIRPPALRTVEDSCYFPYHVDGTSELTMCCNYIVYNESKAPDLLYNMKELRHKSSKWLVDCILHFSIID